MLPITKDNVFWTQNLANLLRTAKTFCGLRRGLITVVWNWVIQYTSSWDWKFQGEYFHLLEYLTFFLMSHCAQLIEINMKNWVKEEQRWWSIHWFITALRAPATWNEHLCAGSSCCWFGPLFLEPEQNFELWQSHAKLRRLYQEITQFNFQNVKGGETIHRKCGMRARDLNRDLNIRSHHWEKYECAGPCGQFEGSSHIIFMFWHLEVGNWNHRFSCFCWR